MLIMTGRPSESSPAIISGMDIPRRKDAGGIVIGESGGIALVRARGGDGAFLFPKGGVEAGETDEQAARREIAEETGLTDLEYIYDLGTFERPPIRPDGSYDFSGLLEIHMFLFATPRGAQPKADNEMDEAKWVPYRDVVNVNGNDKERAFFISRFERVREAIQRD